jgi:aspartate carbamoyltransferase catalytic subunit
MTFPRSIIKSTDLSVDQVSHLFSLAKQLKLQLHLEKKTKLKNENPFAYLFFLENSTRTVSSFERAASLSRVHTAKFSYKASSLEKGETIEDTLLNLLAMQPDLLVVRADSDFKMTDFVELSFKIYPQHKTCFINSGWGTFEHPTQAYLDLFTMIESLNRKPKNVLFVGDVKHSRVFGSNFHLLGAFGVSVSTCGPKDYKSDFDCPHYEDLDECLEFSEVVVVLRVQKERHQFETTNYYEKFGLTDQRLKKLKSDQILMHPGPVNYGVEISSNVHSYPQDKIFSQATNGVFIRQALIQAMLGDFYE